MASSTVFIRCVAGLIFATWLSAPPALAGIVIGGTRIIYPAQSREVTVQLSNVGDGPALVQLWVDEGDAAQSPDDSKAPFIVMPPISRVEAGSGQALRMFFSGSSLPTDRESLFWLNVLEIPPSPTADAPRNYLQLAFRSRIKIFYRPQELPGTANDAPTVLRWQLDADGGVQVRNPTPYHVTLTRIELRDSGASMREVDKRGLMLAPGQSYRFAARSVDAGVSPLFTRVLFTTINDYGGLVTREARFERQH